MKPILSEVLSILPSDKARLYLGFCTPRMVMDLVMEGVDMFDTSMATFLSENGQAFVFPNQLPESEHWSQACFLFTIHANLTVKNITANWDT